MGYSDYSLHAFCYNSGSAFAEYRLNSTHLLTSTKFRYLAQLLPRLKVGGLREVYVLFSGCAVLKKMCWRSTGSNTTHLIASTRSRYLAQLLPGL